MTWRARVVDDFPNMGVRLHLADVMVGGSLFVSQIGPGYETVLARVDEGLAGPEGMRLPMDAAEPLRDALDAYLGKRPDDYRAKYEEARDALEVERARVDRLLTLHTSETS